MQDFSNPMQGFSSYWIVIGFVVILCFLVFVLKPKARRMTRRREKFQKKDLVRLIVPPIAIGILMVSVVAAYIYVKASR